MSSRQSSGRTEGDRGEVGAIRLARVAEERGGRHPAPPRRRPAARSAQPVLPLTVERSGFEVDLEFRIASAADLGAMPEATRAEYRAHRRWMVRLVAALEGGEVEAMGSGPGLWVAGPLGEPPPAIRFAVRWTGCTLFELEFVVLRAEEWWSLPPTTDRLDYRHVDGLYILARPATCTCRSSSRRRPSSTR